jgi:hypothetical protein
MEPRPSIYTGSRTPPTPVGRSGILDRVSLLDMRRADLRRARDAVVKDRKTIADLSTKIATNQGRLSRASTASRVRTLASELERLQKAHVSAEKSLAANEKKAADLTKKVDALEAAEQKRAATAQAQQQRKTAQQLKRVEGRTIEISDRMAVVENALLKRVHDAIVADPVEREHDVFLSHTSLPADVEVSDELYRELTARGLDVWYDGAELRLGESLVRQIDRGIAKSKCGVILITDGFLKGRAWTEQEMSALVNTGRRVIPVLDGVSFGALGKYSPILAERVGLDTERFGMGEIAEQIAATVQGD